ncbi:hypothetical protein CLOM621_08479 [Clostridium sp. M62/1]|nr:hypothetical protein CLOM621_08479 [Clostridium sp. M62/1]
MLCSLFQAPFSILSRNMVKQVYHTRQTCQYFVRGKGAKNQEGNAETGGNMGLSFVKKRGICQY